MRRPEEPLPRSGVLTALLGVGLLIGVTTTACGGALIERVHADDSAYAKRCTASHGAHMGDVAAGRYFPPKLHVERWPGGWDAAQRMPEAKLIDALRKGKVRRIEVTAGGGLGKTRLGEAIEAHLCGEVPTFLVDLGKEVATRKGPSPLLAVLAERLGLSTDADGLEDAKSTLSRGRWILLADAIEEVRLPDRAAAVQAVEEVFAMFPTVTLVAFSRPAVLEQRYGYKPFDAAVSIAPLPFEQADAFLATIATEDGETARLNAFLTAFGLNDKARFGMTTIYPFMASYRDLQVVRKFYQGSKDGELPPSRAAVYEELVGVRLRKELKHLNWSTREALDMVDRLMRVESEAGNLQKPAFTMAKCAKSLGASYGLSAIDAGMEGTPAERAEHICEKVMQSAVMRQTSEAIGAEGTWTFSADALGDLFVARWVNRGLASNPLDRCKGLADHPTIVSSPGVLRFLVSQPIARQCIAPLLGQLCPEGAEKARHLEAVIEGLPTGKDRFDVLQRARAAASEAGGAKCVLDSLSVADKTVGR